MESSPLLLLDHREYLRRIRIHDYITTIDEEKDDFGIVPNRESLYALNKAQLCSGRVPQTIRYPSPPYLLSEIYIYLYVFHILVPFENLDIHRNKPILLDIPHLYEKIVRHRRGGFCFEVAGVSRNRI